MTSSRQLPTTVYLLGCPAEVSSDDGVPTKTSLTGLFDLIEYMTYEPAAGVWGAGYLVASHEEDPAWQVDVMFWVDDDVYRQQVDPSGWAQALVEEREMEWAVEAWEREQG